MTKIAISFTILFFLLSFSTFALDITPQIPKSLRSIEQDSTIAKITPPDQVKQDSITATIDTDKQAITEFNSQTGELRYKGLTEIPSENVKDMSRYHNNEVFLVSDSDWHTVLPLVPLAVWTGSEDCKKGYDLPSDVCAYPLLIYHKEKPEDATVILNKDHLLEQASISFVVYKKPVLDVSPQSSKFTYNFPLASEQLQLNSFLFLDTFFEVPRNPEKSDMVIASEITKLFKINGRSFDIHPYPARYGDLLRVEMRIQVNYLRLANTIEFDKGTSTYSPKRIKIYSPDYSTPGSVNNIRTTKLIGCSNNEIQDTACLSGIEFDKSSLVPGDTAKISYSIKNTGNTVFDEIDFKDKYDLVITSADIPVSTMGLIDYDYEKKNTGIGESFMLTLSMKNKAVPKNGFDADSTIDFLSYFPAQKLLLFEDIPNDLKLLLTAQKPIGAGLNIESINQKSLNDYFSYWKSYNSIVYVEDSYEKALMASVYASLINSPLIIQNSIFDIDNVFLIKKTICIGNVQRNCHESYTLEELEKKYIELTNTRKVIMVNPDDINIIKRFNLYKTDKSGSIQNIFTKDSLVSPILAAAKHELILPFKEKDFWQVDSSLEKKLKNLFDYSLPGQECIAGSECSQGYRYDESLKEYISNTDTIYSFSNIDESREHYLVVVSAKGDCQKIPTLLAGSYYIWGDSIYLDSDEKRDYVFRVPTSAISKSKTIKFSLSTKYENRFYNCDYYTADMKLTWPTTSDIFLTIIASPDAIPISSYQIQIPVCEDELSYLELDSRVYGSSADFGYQDINVGRISGISVSDTSSYISRDLFFTDLTDRSKDVLLIMRGGSDTDTETKLRDRAKFFWTDELKSNFENSYEYYTYAGVTEKIEEIRDRYLSSSLVIYDDHGESSGFSGTISTSDFKENRKHISPNAIIGIACLTCFYSGYGSSFCMQNLRRGAMAYQGATDTSYWHSESDEITRETIINKKTIGESVRTAKNAEINFVTSDLIDCHDGDQHFALIGDPTWRPRWW